MKKFLTFFAFAALAMMVACGDDDTTPAPGNTDGPEQGDENENQGGGETPSPADLIFPEAYYAGVGYYEVDDDNYVIMDSLYQYLMYFEVINEDSTQYSVLNLLASMVYWKGEVDAAAKTMTFDGECFMVDPETGDPLYNEDTVNIFGQIFDAEFFEDIEDAQLQAALEEAFPNSNCLVYVYAPYAIENQQLVPSETFVFESTEEGIYSQGILYQLAIPATVDDEGNIAEMLDDEAMSNLWIDPTFDIVPGDYDSETGKFTPLEPQALTRAAMQSVISQLPTNFNIENVVANKVMVKDMLVK